MSSPAADIAAVVVAYNSGEELRRCVGLLLQSVQVAQLVVVDNASSDGMPQQLADFADARLRVLEQPRNLGFGAAMNLGVAATTAPWLVLVNPDVELPGPALERLRDQAGRAELAPLGVLSCVLVDAQGRADPASLRLDPTPCRVIGQMLGLSRLGWGIAQRARAGLNEVQACSGALLLLPRSAYLAVDGFDPGYFLHAEDLDLCRRLRLQGLRAWVDADVRVLHHKGTSSGQRLTVLRHKQAGLLRYFERFDAPRLGPLRRACVRGVASLLFALQRGICRLRGGT